MFTKSEVESNHFTEEWEAAQEDAAAAVIGLVCLQRNLKRQRHGLGLQCSRILSGNSR